MTATNRPTSRTQRWLFHFWVIQPEMGGVRAPIKPNNEKMAFARTSDASSCVVRYWTMKPLIAMNAASSNRKMRASAHSIGLFRARLMLAFLVPVGSSSFSTLSRSSGLR